MLWPGDRLILEGVCTLQEQDAHWSIEDVAHFNDTLDAYQQAKADATKPPAKG